MSRVSFAWIALVLALAAVAVTVSAVERSGAAVLDAESDSLAVEDADALEVDVEVEADESDEAEAEDDTEADDEAEVDTEEEADADAEGETEVLTAAEAEAGIAMDSTAVQEVVAETSAEATIRMATEPKNGETEAAFNAALVTVKSECKTKCNALSGLRTFLGQMNSGCVDPCTECIEWAERLVALYPNQNQAADNLRYNVLSLRCYATTKEMNRDIWRRYVAKTPLIPDPLSTSRSPLDVKTPASEHPGAGYATKFNECKPSCTAAHANGDALGFAKRKCIELCGFCLEQKETLGTDHFHINSHKCHAYDAESVQPKIEALQTQTQYSAACGAEIPVPPTARTFSQKYENARMNLAWEPTELLFDKSGSRYLDTTATRAALRNYVQLRVTSAITTDALCPGDIIIRHSYADGCDVSVAKLHRLEYQGSKVILAKDTTSPAQVTRGASAFAVHALLSTGYNRVVEAMKPGVIFQATPNTDQWVYRPRNRAMALDAAKHATWLSNQGVEYSALSVVKASLVSVFSHPEFEKSDRGSSIFTGSGIAKAITVSDGIRQKDKSKLPGAMMCIETVINSFHAAKWAQMNLVPQFTTPVSLEKFIHNHPDEYVFVGVLPADPTKYYIPMDH